MLRTLASRLRQQDWTAVGIEVLIVVSGVFIGLEVNDWNEGRKDAARGKEYLLRLHDELLQDAEGLTQISAFWTQVGANGAAAMAYAEDGVLNQGSGWKTLLAYYQASQVRPYRKPDVTFQEIRSTGSLLLIRNGELRAEVARHYSAGAGSQVTEVLGLIPRYREHVRGLVPWKIQQYIWAHCYDSVCADQVLYYERREIERLLTSQPTLGQCPDYIAEDLPSGSVNVATYNGAELAASLVNAYQGHGRPALVKALESAGLGKPGTERAKRLLSLGREQLDALRGTGWDLCLTDCPGNTHETREIEIETREIEM